MNDKTRIAVLQRVGAVIGNDRPIPQNWNEFSVTEQLAISNADPTIAAVIQGQGYMSAELEQQVLAGTLPATYDGPTVEAQRAAQQQALLAEVEQRMQADLEQLHQRNQQMALARAQAQQEAQLLGQAQQIATARARFQVGA